MRIFIGIPLSKEVEREVEKLYKSLKKKHWKVKWEPIHKIHLTLAFLGNIKNKKSKTKNTNLKTEKLQSVGIIKAAVEDVCQSLQSIKVEFKGLGCFPDYDWPRIIWLGLKGDLKSLSFLQKKIRENLKKAGFDFDERPFRAHLTLGRIKRARAKERREIGRQIKKMQKMDFKKEWVIDKVVVYESKCLPKGSKYFELFSCRL